MATRFQLITLCCLMVSSSSVGWCQDRLNAANRAQESNRQGAQSKTQESAGDKQDTRCSGNKQTAAQETDKKPTTAPFTVTLKNGTVYQVSKTERLRNGNVRVTLTDGSVITIAKKDLAKIVDNSQPAEDAETRTPPGRKPGNSSNSKPPGRGSSNRNSPPASSDRPKKIEEQSSIQPQLLTSPTLTLVVL